MIIYLGSTSSTLLIYFTLYHQVFSFSSRASNYRIFFSFPFPLSLGNILTRNRWTEDEVQDLFTDGLRVASLAGAGQHRNDKDFLFEKHATVFQTEVFAILPVATRKEVRNGHMQEKFASTHIDGSFQKRQCSTVFPNSTL